MICCGLHIDMTAPKRISHVTDVFPTIRKDGLFDIVQALDS